MRKPNFVQTYHRLKRLTSTGQKKDLRHARAIIKNLPRGRQTVQGVGGTRTQHWDALHDIVNEASKKSNSPRKNKHR